MRAAGPLDSTRIGGNNKNRKRKRSNNHDNEDPDEEGEGDNDDQNEDVLDLALSLGSDYGSRAESWKAGTVVLDLLAGAGDALRHRVTDGDMSSGPVDCSGVENNAKEVARAATALLVEALAETTTTTISTTAAAAAAAAVLTPQALAALSDNDAKSVKGKGKGKGKVVPPSAGSGREACMGIALGCSRVLLSLWRCLSAEHRVAVVFAMRDAATEVTAGTAGAGALKKGGGGRERERGRGGNRKRAVRGRKERKGKKRADDDDDDDERGKDGIKPPAVEIDALRLALVRFFRCVHVYSWLPRRALDRHRWRGRVDCFH